MQLPQGLPIAPLPVKVDVGQAKLGNGDVVPVMTFSSPQGQQVYFLNREVAETVIAALTNVVNAGAIILNHHRLIVPPPGGGAA